MAYRTELNVSTGETLIIEISADEVAAMQAAEAARRADPTYQISMLESSITPQRLRDAILTDDGKAWLADVNAQIAELQEAMQP